MRNEKQVAGLVEDDDVLGAAKIGVFIGKGRLALFASQMMPWRRYAGAPFSVMISLIVTVSVYASSTIRSLRARERK